MFFFLLLGNCFQRTHHSFQPFWRRRSGFPQSVSEQVHYRSRLTTADIGSVTAFFCREQTTTATRNLTYATVYLLFSVTGRYDRNWVDYKTRNNEFANTVMRIDAGTPHAFRLLLCKEYV